MAESLLRIKERNTSRTPDDLDFRGQYNVIWATKQNAVKLALIQTVIKIDDLEWIKSTNRLNFRPTDSLQKEEPSAHPLQRWIAYSSFHIAFYSTNTSSRPVGYIKGTIPENNPNCPPNDF